MTGVRNDTQLRRVTARAITLATSRFVGTTLDPVSVAELTSLRSRRRFRRRGRRCAPAGLPRRTGHAAWRPVPARRTPGQTEPATQHDADDDPRDHRQLPGLRPDPAPLRRSGERAARGDLLTARQRQPDRRPERKPGQSGLRPNHRPGRVNPRREEINTSDHRLGIEPEHATPGTPLMGHTECRG